MRFERQENIRTSTQKLMSGFGKMAGAAAGATAAVALVGASSVAGEEAAPLVMDKWGKPLMKKTTEWGGRIGGSDGTISSFMESSKESSKS